MTRYFFFSLLFVVAALVSSNKSFAGNHSAVSVSVNSSKETMKTTPAEPKETIPVMPVPPAANQENHGGKVNPPKMEELPHIHHFHKERVRKVKRHHRKVWTLVKLIIILCHIGLIICGYLHATH